MTDEEIDAIIQQILLKKLKPFDIPKNINAKCIETGNTALILAAASGEILFVKRLLVLGADITLRNLDDANAFRLAIYGSHEGVVQTLLPFETRESLNYVDCRGDTALSLAARLDLTTVESNIMVRGGIIPRFKMEMLRTPSQIRRRFLDSLQQNGPLLRDNSSVPRSMFVNCFADNKSVRFPMDYLEYLFLSPHFRILMILVAQVSSSKRSKQFLFHYRFHKDMLFSGNAKNWENIWGYFNYKTKDIYCFYTQGVSIETLVNLFHELMHLVMDVVYENNASPYVKDDSEKEKRFDRVLDETKTILDKLRSDKMSSLEAAVYSSLCVVYRIHLPHEMARELIVKIPETLIRMGIEQGMAWLKPFKALMAYYEEIVIPDMKAKCKDLAHEESQIPLTPLDIVLRRIYERKFCFYTYMDTEEMRNCEQLTPEEFKKMKEAALFFQYDAELINKFEIHVGHIRNRKIFISVAWSNRIRYSVMLLEELAKELVQLKGDPGLIASFEQYIQNRKILDAFFLDCNDKIHLQYWSEQVRFRGCSYKGHRIPHTVANIFNTLEEGSGMDGPTEEFLERIHEARKKPSGSRIGFFGRSRVVEELRARPDEDFLRPIHSRFSQGL